MPNQSERKPNRLIHETSPYLLQHAYNPVDWWPWGDTAFEEAKRRDVPVFLSIGYSTCHWCHVMERESFEDETVAKALSRSFIAIKVDREERPDVDHIYMMACMALNQQGGWPLSVFLTPDRKPFFAGTYFPKEDRYGMMGFLSLLQRIALLWKGERKRLLASADTILSHISDDDVTEGEITKDLADRAAHQLLGSYDPRYGGFGSAPKFPTPHNLTFLMMWAQDQPNDHPAWHAVSHTLDAMADGGIRDQIGGGFFRYSTDERWTLPHFEKMLYDQALLLIAYSQAIQRYGSKPAWEEVVRSTIHFLMHDMRAESGGFFTAFDADSEGIEGKYYLWTPEQVKAVLGDREGERFCKLLNIQTKGHLPQGCNPNWTGNNPTDEDRAFAAQCLPKLEVTRSRRIPPHRDEKILLTSNALLMVALAEAGCAMEEPEWIQAALDIAAFAHQHLLRKDGRLLGTWTKGYAAHPATLDGYAYWVWGLLALYRATLDSQWLSHAIHWMKQTLMLFEDGEGGLFYAGNDMEDLPARPRNTQDGAVPSGVSIAALDLALMGRLTGDISWMQQADKLLCRTSAEVYQAPAGYTALLQAWLFLAQPGMDVVLTEGEGLEEMTRALRGYHPAMTVLLTSPQIAQIAPFTRDMHAIEGQATAYVCRGNACSAPISDASQLKAMLAASDSAYIGSTQ